MIYRWRPLLASSSVAGIVLGLMLTSPATADVPLPVQGSLTVTVPGGVTPITLTAGASSPAMTFTAFGIGLSGFPNSTNFAAEIQVRPSTGVTWSTDGWTPKGTCPTTSPASTTTLTDCGISAVYINDVNVTSNAKVYVDVTANISPSFIIKSVSGSFISDVDAVGTVRVELDAGAWILEEGANTTRGFGMWVRNATTSQQGTAYTNTRSVVFDPNGGTGNPYTQTWTINATKALIANAFTREGYTFSKWTTEKDGTGDSYLPGANYTFATNQTLYAQWTDNSDPEPSPPDDDDSENPDRESSARGDGDGGNTGADPAASPEETLARTGSNVVASAALALAMVVAGVLLLATKRRIQ